MALLELGFTKGFWRLPTLTKGVCTLYPLVLLDTCLTSNIYINP